MNPLPDCPFITAPLRDVNAWATAMHSLPIPVQAETAMSVNALRANEDAVDARLLSETLSADPLMTLSLLRHVAAQRGSRCVTDAETVTEATVLLGITPFFQAFQDLPTIEARLADQPQALHGLKAVLRRADRAARFALGFAVHRMDHDAAVIHEAALLHDFAEMLLWAHAPSLALEVQRLLQSDPGLRSVLAQRAVLHVSLPELQQTLMQRWHLPELLVQITRDEQATNSRQMRNVQLAIRVARHSSQGWDNPALPEDMSELGLLLNLSAPHVQQLLIELDA